MYARQLGLIKLAPEINHVTQTLQMQSESCAWHHY